MELGAFRKRCDQPRRRDGRVPTDPARGNREDRRPEHGHHGREAGDHEDDDRDERQEVVAIALRERPRPGRVDGHAGTLEAPRIQFHHHEERCVEEDRGDRRHADHVEVRDLQELGDEERSRAEHRRRQDRTEPTGRQQPACRFLRVPGPREQRIGDGAQRDRRGDTAARRPAEQEGSQHDRPTGRRTALPHHGEREVDEELARAGCLKDRAVHGEEDDEGRAHVDRCAEDAFHRHRHVPHQAIERIASMRPGRGQPRPDEGIRDERRHHDRQHPSGGPTHGLEHQQHQQATGDDIPGFGLHGAVRRGIPVTEEPRDAGDSEAGEQPVPGHHAVAETSRHRQREEQKPEHQRDVQTAQPRRTDDVDGRIEMEHGRACKRDGQGDRQRTSQAIGRAILLLDETLGLREAIRLDGVRALPGPRGVHAGLTAASTPSRRRSGPHRDERGSLRHPPSGIRETAWRIPCGPRSCRCADRTPSSRSRRRHRRACWR